MESTQVLECTQVLDSQSSYVDERIETPVQVATLTVDGVDYSIWNRENTIGRDAKCSVVLNSKAVSVEHAVIEADLQGGHFICDLGSTNKTKLGDVQLKPRVKYFIKDGDLLKIANLKGVYRHVKIADKIPPESSTPPLAEVTAIPESPERKEEDAVESIIAETPRKDEGNGADGSDGDIFGEISDSSALFVRPLNLPANDVPNSRELTKTGGSDVERFGFLEDPKKDASIYAAASQSVAGQSSVLHGNEVVDESYATDPDSSDLVIGSQPMFTPEKRLYDPKVFDCNTVPPVAHNLYEELTEPPKDCDHWENIDDSVDEISDHMDTIDSLVENNSLQVTYTPPKRKADNPDVSEVTSKPNDLDSPQPVKADGEANIPSSSSPNMKKFNKKKVVRNLEEGLDVRESSTGGQPLIDSVVPGNYEKPVSVYELETQDMAGDDSNVKTANIEVKDSYADESTDIVVGSQPTVATDEGSGKENIFTNDTVPMEDPVNERNLSKCNIFDLATQQVQNESGMERFASRNNSDIYDLATQPFAIPEDKIKNISRELTTANREKMGLPAEVTAPETADISISDLPTQAVSGVAERAHDGMVVQKRESVLENAPLQDCDLSISDMATQAVTVLETNRELSSIHETSIADMPTQAVQKCQNQERELDRCKKEYEPCDISLSDIATQASVPRSIEKVISAPPDEHLSDQSNNSDTVRKNKNELQDSEDIYDVKTQLPVERTHIVLEESNTQLMNSDIQKAFHNVSVSEMLTQPSKSKSDKKSEVHHVADVSISDLPTQAAVATNDFSAPGDSSKNVNFRLVNEETEDIFNVMTQLPVSKDRIILEASDTQLLNSKVEKGNFDVSLSDMMTQPSESNLGAPRGIPTVDISISDLPTQAPSAEGIDRVVNQDSEDIYNVMTQMPVENERILLDVSDTQQINTDLENCELEIFDSALKSSTSIKTEGSLERMKGDEIQFKIPTPVKHLKKEQNRKNMDVYMVDTQPMEFHNTSNDPNPINDEIVCNKPALAKSVPIEIPACGKDSISALATQEENNALPVDSAISKNVIDDIFEVDTLPIIDQSETIHRASENALSSKENACVTVHAGMAENEVVLETFVKETDKSCDQHPVVPSTQEIDPNSVEDRIRAMSDKNVNSFATQQILTSSNTKSTVAELLETLEDTSSQVVRVNRKVKRLEYTDSEDSNSPIVRFTRKAKALDRPESEEDNESPLVVPKKSCLPLKDTQDEVENLLSELEKDASTPANGSDILYNGSVKHPNKSAQKDTPSVTASPLVNDLPKNTKSEPLKGDVPSLEKKEGDSRTLVNSEAVKDSVSDGKGADAVKADNGRPAGVEHTESFISAARKSTDDNFALVEEKTSVVEPSATNYTGGSDSLKLHISADASVNKSNAESVSTTPEKQTDTVFKITPSTRDLKELRNTTPETPEIPKDFFGTPMFRDKPILRQYVNKKKLSLSSTSLLKGPNASSTPKSELDSPSVLEMEETLKSAKVSTVKTHKVEDVEQKTVSRDYNTPKNVKKFKKASPQKRKSAEMVENSSQDNDLLNSQESFDSQECGRGKRRKQKNNFFGFDGNEDVEFTPTRPSQKYIESVQDTLHSESQKRSTSPLKTAGPESLSDENHMGSDEKAVCEKMKNNETVKRQCKSENSLKRGKLSLEAEGVKRLSNKESDDMELTCVRSSSLKEDVEEAVVNVKKFKRASPKKLEPVSIQVIPKNESNVESTRSSQPLNTSQRRKRNVCTPESDSGKDITGHNRNNAQPSKPASTLSGGSSFLSPTKSFRGRKASDMKQNADSETESHKKPKRNRVQNTLTSSQETPEPEGEETGSQEISIKSMANRLQGAMKSKMKLEEESIQQPDRRGRSRQNAVGPNTEMKKGEHIRDGNAEKGSAGGNISSSPSQISLKKEVKKRGRPRKAVNENEETLEKTEENIPNIELSKSTTSSVRKGRRKLETAQEDSITVSSGTQASSTSLEVPAPKRGRRAKNVTADNNDAATGLSDSQNALSASISNSDVSKTKRRGKNTPNVEDSSAFETDQDSQSQDLSQGRRSGRARKKKETFDEIMSRKEEEIKLKKLQIHSALSQSPDQSRSTSRASVASSLKTEEDGSVMSAPKRRGRPKKSVAGTSASTSTILSVDDDAPFSIPPSPAGSNSSRRKTPRPGSASSSHSVNAETSPKLKEESGNPASASIVKVMFTGLADAKLSSMVKKLGGKVVEKPTDCTVLVTDKVRRTVKFLCALGLGKPIVSPNWLSKSKSFNKFTDTNASLLQDSEAEEKFDFKLKESLEKTKNSRLLEGYSFYATPSVLPPPAEIKQCRD